MKKCYENTDIPIKVGHIVVIKKGISCGNEAKVITRVTKVDVTGIHLHNDRTISCESMKFDNFGQIRHNQSVKTKLPSFYEDISDVRLASEDERKIFFRRQSYGGVVYAADNV